MFWLIAVAPATARPPMPEWLGVRSSEIWIVGQEVVVSAKPMLVVGRYIIMSRFPIVKLADKFIRSAAVDWADSFSVHIECHSQDCIFAIAFLTRATATTITVLSWP